MFYALELRLRLIIRRIVFGALALIALIVSAVYFTRAGLVALAELYDPQTALLIVGGIYLALALILLLMANRRKVPAPPPPPATSIASLLEAFLAGRAAGTAAGRRGGVTRVLNVAETPPVCRVKGFPELAHRRAETHFEDEYYGFFIEITD